MNAEIIAELIVKLKLLVVLLTALAGASAPQNSPLIFGAAITPIAPAILPSVSANLQILEPYAPNDITYTTTTDIFNSPKNTICPSATKTTSTKKWTFSSNLCWYRP